MIFFDCTSDKAEQNLNINNFFLLQIKKQKMKKVSQCVNFKYYYIIGNYIVSNIHFN